MKKKMTPTHIPKLELDEILLILCPGPVDQEMADGIEKFIKENPDQQLMFFDPRIKFYIAKRTQVEVVQTDKIIKCDHVGCYKDGLFEFDGNLYCHKHMVQRAKRKGSK